MNLCDIQSGQSLAGFYLLKQASLRTTAAGKPYLAAAITDRTGTVEMKVWDYSGPISHEDEGKIVCIQGRVSEFKGALQVTADRIRLAQDNDRYDLSLLVPTAPLDLQETLEELDAMLSSMEDEGYREVCREMLRRHQRAFTTIPAAKSVHHGFVHGLLMHTVNMMKTAVFLAAQYGEFLDRDLLLAGTFLHDFAKIREFQVSQTGLVTDYTTQGQLLGHLVMGAQEVGGICAACGVPEARSTLLQHMILSHHGQPEFGAAVLPQCAEAELLCYIDMIDSRMEIYREVLDKTEVGQFSDRVFALDNKRLYRHK
ncbi:MAG: HD domain-containing protein [Clostridia bacterium]|nr:HD domain-containing protein [Clostridia bacterium]MBR6574894.1 HD domain-containing protein [Clostridia bacterium]